MALRHTLEVVKNEALKQVKEKKKEEEEDGLKATNENLLKVRNKKEVASGILADMEEKYDAAQQSLETYKKSKQDIQKIFEEYGDTLKDLGITAPEGLLTHSELQNEEDVIAYAAARKNLKEKITELQGVKQSVRTMVPDARFGGHKEKDARVSKREKTQAALKEKIKEADAQEQELYKQTPEGKMAQEQRAREAIAELVEKTGYRREVKDVQDIKNISTSLFNSEKGSEICKEFGKDFVRQTLNTYIHEEIDSTMHSRMETEHLNDHVRKSIEVIRNADSYYDEVQKKLGELGKDKQSLEQELKEYLATHEADVHALNVGGWTSVPFIVYTLYGYKKWDEELSSRVYESQKTLKQIKEGSYEYRGTITYDEQEECIAEIEMVKRVHERARQLLHEGALAKTLTQEELREKFWGNAGVVSFSHISRGVIPEVFKESFESRAARIEERVREYDVQKERLYDFTDKTIHGRAIEDEGKDMLKNLGLKSSSLESYVEGRERDNDSIEEIIHEVRVEESSIHAHMSPTIDMHEIKIESGGYVDMGIYEKNRMESQREGDQMRRQIEKLEHDLAHEEQHKPGFISLKKKEYERHVEHIKEEITLLQKKKEEVHNTWHEYNQITDEIWKHTRNLSRLVSLAKDYARLEEKKPLDEFINDLCAALEKAIISIPVEVERLAHDIKSARKDMDDAERKCVKEEKILQKEKLDFMF